MEVNIKAKFISRCLFCVGMNSKNPVIKVGDEIIPHPSVQGKWVHKFHLSKPKQMERKEDKQIRLF